jgi:hypothetical protein
VGAPSSFPTTVQQFTAFFSSEEAYESYFECCRWPDGFVCIRRVSIDGWRIIRVVPTEHASFVKVRGNPCRWSVNLSVPADQ